MRWDGTPNRNEMCGWMVAMLSTLDGNVNENDTIDLSSGEICWSDKLLFWLDESKRQAKFIHGNITKCVWLFCFFAWMKFLTSLLGVFGFLESPDGVERSKTGNGERFEFELHRTTLLNTNWGELTDQRPRENRNVEYARRRNIMNVSATLMVFPSRRSALLPIARPPSPPLMFHAKETTRRMRTHDTNMLYIHNVCSVLHSLHILTNTHSYR